MCLAVRMELGRSTWCSEGLWLKLGWLLKRMHSQESRSMSARFFFPSSLRVAKFPQLLGSHARGLIQKEVSCGQQPTS